MFTALAEVYRLLYGHVNSVFYILQFKYIDYCMVMQISFFIYLVLNKR